MLIFQCRRFSRQYRSRAWGVKSLDNESDKKKTDKLITNKKVRTIILLLDGVSFRIPYKTPRYWQKRKREYFVSLDYKRKKKRKTTLTRVKFRGSIIIFRRQDPFTVETHERNERGSFCLFDFPIVSFRRACDFDVDVY